MRRLIGILLVLALMSTSVFAQGDENNSDISPELQEQIEIIERNTEALRGLDPLEEIAIYFPTRAELRAYLDSVFEEEYTPDILASDTAFYVAFELIPTNYDLYNELLAIYEQQIGGYYDTETRFMNVILNSGEKPDTFLPLLERIVYAHEYVHALQDQYFDLDTYIESAANDDNVDRYLAMLAVVEGDATFIMNEYTIRETQENPAMALLQIGMAAAQNPALLGLPPGTPDIFTNELIFPYNQGAVLIGDVFADGGWDAVNAIYSNPPVSTEQVLHTEKYFAGEMPIAVNMRDTSSAIGDDWQLARTGVMGEFYLRQYLGTQFGRNVVDEAATGWGGDGYNIYRNSDGALAWQAAFVWDNEDEAIEFAGYYADFITERIEMGETEGDCTIGTDITICTQLNGDMVLIGVAPTAETAQILLHTAQIPFATGQ